MKNQSMVNISVSTLNALKQLLFSSENGVDLSSIVKDISTGLNTNEDLTAVNVGLTFKGIKPEIDKTTRYVGENTYWRQYARLEFVDYSLILDRVSAKRTTISREKESNMWKEEEPCEFICSLEDWLNKPTTPVEFIEEINKKYPLPETNESAV